MSMRTPSISAKEYFWRITACIARGVSCVCHAIGLAQFLEKQRGNFWLFHLRTLLALRNIADMVHLDIPWWTYKAIREVEAFIASKPNKIRVFEYGSGASTVWLAKRVAEVISVEHHAGFGEVVKAHLKDLPNAKLIVQEPDEPHTANPVFSTRKGMEGLDFSSYLHSIDTVEGNFDLIIVDGLVRRQCLEKAKERLNAGGIILFDNTNKRKFRKALAESGLAVQRCYGWTPCISFFTETTILRRPA